MEIQERENVVESQSISDRVKTIVMEKLDKTDGAVVLGASLQDDLMADSLDIVELMMALEEEFDIEIRDEDVEEIATVKDVITYIERRITEKSFA